MIADRGSDNYIPAVTMAAATASVSGWTAVVGGSVAMTLPQSCQDWGGPQGRKTALAAAAVAAGAAAALGCRIRRRFPPRG